jgi:hypothetical protein
LPNQFNSEHQRGIFRHHPFDLSFAISAEGFRCECVTRRHAEGEYQDANQGQFRIHPSIAQSTVPQGSNLEYSSQAVVFWLDWVEFILAETRNCPGNLRSSGFFHVALLEAKGMLVTHTCR